MTMRRILMELCTIVSLPVLAAAPVFSRSISNTASVTWMTSLGQATSHSNTVDLPVAATPAMSANIFALRPSGEAGGQVSRIDRNACVMTSGTALGGVYGTSAIGQVALKPTADFHAGDMVGLGVGSAMDDRDPTARDSLDVIVRTANGDQEQVTLTEDAANSGFFVGAIASGRIPPALIQGDCRLSVPSDTPTELTVQRRGASQVLATAQLRFSYDAGNTVFDSGDGAPVSDVRATVIDMATGRPATVYGDDGVSIFPSAVVSGATVLDSGGTSYSFAPGHFRFPLLAPGRYRLLVEPAEPYSPESKATPDQLAKLLNPNTGDAYTINGISFGEVFTLIAAGTLISDIPIDRPLVGLSVAKIASEADAVAGDVIQYRVTTRNDDPTRASGLITITDELPNAIRLRPTTVRYNGTLIEPTVSPDGRRMSVSVPSLPAGESGILTYIGEVRVDAQAGDAVNVVSATDDRGTRSNRADANVRIRRDIIGDRVTIAGRVTAGGCGVDRSAAKGIGGVRVMLQDGSFAVTDPDGRYHFQGVRPGLSVVQIDPASLPSGMGATDCARNTRSAGSPISRFVEGRGGALIRADFRAAPIALLTPEERKHVANVAPLSPPTRPAQIDDATAAGGSLDMFSGRKAGIAWIFPGTQYNPRTGSTRIAISHLPDQRVELSVNGEGVDALNFDGAGSSPDKSFKVSVWRGVPLRDGANRFVARVLNRDGSLVQQLTREVALSIGAMNAAFLPERSLLVADGINRPVIAVRLTDSHGNPIRKGVVGQLAIDPPHRAALDVDLEQRRQLSGSDRVPATWRVDGDDGVAYIELEPTSASGSARLNFTFQSEKASRTQKVDVWLNPGERPWTIVGFAAGSVGYNTLNDHLVSAAKKMQGDTIDGRVALYARGRVLGKWLLTLAYDSDKEKDQARFGGVIDPHAYYTIYADRSEVGFDAASAKNLYVRLERPQFNALFGDFQTGFNDTELARYQRALTGARAEYRGRNFAATAFVADTPYRHRRDEIQGNGMTGPYQLGRRSILANSERVVLEVRDRLRPDVIVSTKTLSRYADYDIDYFAGTLRFREPILSRDFDLNPQFVVVDYEVDGAGTTATNAGGRATWTSGADEKVRVGATFIRDETDVGSTNLGGMDVRVRPSASTEVRAEYARSSGAGRSADAWLVEAEHHGKSIDVLGYVRERQTGFGVGQLSANGDSSRRYGLDGTWRIATGLSLSGSAWQEEYFDRDARRRAVQLTGEWRRDTTSLRAGLIHADDQLSGGGANRSTLAQIGAARRLFGNKLELSGQTEFAIDSSDDSVDFPSRHTLGARLAVTKGVALTGGYEIASGGSVSSRTARAGFDVEPWAGARANLSGANQSLGERGQRSFAAYGLRQSFQVNDRVTIDATFDGQRTLRGIRAGDVINPSHPVASGGFLPGDGSLSEDFAAITGGATYRRDDWTMTGRGEYRNGDITDRYGLNLGVIRKIGEGRALGGMFTWALAKGHHGLKTETRRGELSWANRPGDSAWSWMNKTELRTDRVENAIAGESGPIGGPALLVSGDVKSHRIVNSLSINLSPRRRGGEGRWLEAGSYSLFWGARWTSNRFGEDDIKGWSTTVGADWRFDLSDHIGLGAAGNARIGTSNRTIAWSGGPQLVISPIENTNFQLGYNFQGYRDRDFEAARYSRSGFYITAQLKFDQSLLSALKR